LEGKEIILEYDYGNFPLPIPESKLFLEDFFKRKVKKFNWKPNDPNRYCSVVFGKLKDTSS